MSYFSRLMRRLRENPIFWLSVTGTLILHLVIAWQPLSRLEGFYHLHNNGPLMDDSYIFFTMSRDLSDWFSGCNPSFKLSSGFQPLIALFYCPFFHFLWKQKELPIHLALSLNVVLGFCANILLYYLLRKITSRTIATFLVSVWIWSPYVMMQSVNGMETTLALLLLFIIVGYYWRINQASPSKHYSWFFLGLLIGIGFWARVDLAIIGVAIFLDQIWLARKDNRQLHALRLRKVILCGLTALAVASPWMIFYLLSTGAIIPISGRAVHLITSAYFDYVRPNNFSFPLMMFSYFKKEFLIFQPLVALSRKFFWQLLISGLGVVGFVFCMRDYTLRSLLRPVWIFQVLILLSYIVAIGGFWHLNRYFYPVYTSMLFLHAATLRSLESKFKFKQLAFAVILLSLFVPYALSYAFQYYSYLSKDIPSRYLSACYFAKNYIPPKVKIGAFQSGCLSYWLDNEVVNLDGVINEDAYFHLKNKTLGVYLDEQHIEYIVEEVNFGMWDSCLEGQLTKQYSLMVFKKNNKEPKTFYHWSIFKRKKEDYLE